MPDDRPAPAEAVQQPSLADRRAFAVRVAAFYATSFVIIGLYLPYFPVWLKSRGLGVGEVGLVLAMPMLLRVVSTPLVAFLADRLADQRLVLTGLVLGTLASFLGFAFAGSLGAILVAMALYGAAGPSIFPLIESVALAGVRRAGLDYGHMRVWGSITFVLASFAGGAAVGWLGPGAVPWLLLAATAATLLSALALPPAPGSPRGPQEPAARLRPGEAVDLLRERPFLLFLAATGAIQSSHAFLYAFGTLGWQAQGIGPAMIGLLWAVGVLAEIALFAVSGWPLRALGPLGMLLLGGLAAVLRWLALALQPPVWALLPLQILHGLSFGASHLGAVHFIASTVPGRLAATAQGIYAAATGGVAMAALVALAGPIYAGLGAGGYGVMAAIAGIGLLLVGPLARASGLALPSWRG